MNKYDFVWSHICPKNGNQKWFTWLPECPGCGKERPKFSREWKV